MSSVVVVLVLLVDSLGGLSSVLEEQFPNPSFADVKAQSDQVMMMSPKAEDSTMDPYSMYFSDYYMIPSDVGEKRFGGDRSDEFLYPPESYYKQWAEEEREKDEMANNNC